MISIIRKRSILNRFSKGYVALISFKLALFLVFTLIVSCTTDESLLPEQSVTNSLDRFEKNLDNSAQFYLRNSESFNIQKEQDEIAINNALEFLNPFLQESKNMLKEIGFTDSELKSYFGNENDTRIAIIGLIIFIQNKIHTDRTHLSSNQIFFQTVNAQSNWNDTDRIIKCALTALGVNFFASFGTLHGSAKDKWTKMAVKKLLGKVASRMLGPVGVAITIGSFVICMSDWDKS